MLEIYQTEDKRDDTAKAIRYDHLKFHRFSWSDIIRQIQLREIPEDHAGDASAIKLMARDTYRFWRRLSAWDGEGVAPAPTTDLLSAHDFGVTYGDGNPNRSFIYVVKDPNPTRTISPKVVAVSIPESLYRKLEAPGSSDIAIDYLVTLHPFPKRSSYDIKKYPYGSDWFPYVFDRYLNAGLCFGNSWSWPQMIDCATNPELQVPYGKYAWRQQVFQHSKLDNIEPIHIFPMYRDGQGKDVNVAFMNDFTKALASDFRSRGITTHSVSTRSVTVAGFSSSSKYAQKFLLLPNSRDRARRQELLAFYEKIKEIWLLDPDYSVNINHKDMDRAVKWLLRNDENTFRVVGGSRYQSDYIKTFWNKLLAADRQGTLGLFKADDFDNLEEIARTLLAEPRDSNGAQGVLLNLLRADMALLEGAERDDLTLIEEDALRTSLKTKLNAVLAGEPIFDDDARIG
ncbi:MAG: hypothetical protein AAF570_19855, partial [Bacteroidota bacterium]